MDIEEFLKIPNIISRFNAIDELNDVLCKKIKYGWKLPLLTLFYSITRGFYLRWGLKNNDTTNSIRLSVLDKSIEPLLNGETFDILFRIETQVYPLILFNLAIRAVVISSTLPIQNLPLYINEKFEPFSEIVQNRLRGDLKLKNQNEENNVILEDVQIDNYSTKIGFYGYIYPYPKKTFCNVLENVHIWTWGADEFWVCPRPDHGYYKIYHLIKICNNFSNTS